MQIQKELAANQKLLEEALQNEETNNVKANEVPPYRGTSLIRNSSPLGPYSRLMPRALWWS